MTRIIEGRRESFRRGTFQLESRTRARGKVLRVLLVEDHHIVREGLKSVLERDGRVEVAGQADGPEEALRLTLQGRFDLVLMDVSMPGGDGVQCLTRMKRLHPNLPVLMLTAHTDAATVVRAMEAGAQGYLPKSILPEDLVRALDSVLAGGVYVHPSVASKLFRERLPDGTPNLSPREGHVLHRAAQGMTSAQIGAELSVSESTVKSHLRSLYRKLKAANRSELIYRAMTEGLLG